MREIRVPACLVLAALAAGRPELRATAQTSSQIASDFRAQLDHRLREIASAVDGVVGYEVVDLTSGDRFAHLEREVFPTASTIKLALVYELFKQVEEGKISLDESIRLNRSSAVGGSGVLFHLGTPTLSIRDYATLMVIVSDNTATNVLIDRLGMGNVAARLTTLGLTATKLRRHMMDAEAARRGDENVSSPEELVKLLEAIQSQAPAVALLEKPKESRLRRGLPAGVAVADKPGELEGVRVDAGIVFVPNRPYIVAIMTTYLKDEALGERAIAEMSRAVYEHFNRLGSGGNLGRKIPAAPNR